MIRILKEFWADESGMVAGPEWALIASVLVLGSIGAMLAFHNVADTTDNSTVSALVSLTQPQ